MGSLLIVLLLGQTWSDGPFSGAYVESPASTWNHKYPFSLPVLVPALGLPQTKLCPHQNYPPQLPPQGVFNLPFRTTCLPYFLPHWLFSVPYPGCLDTKAGLVLPKWRGDPHPTYIFILNSDNHPKGSFLKERTEDSFWSLTGLNAGCVTLDKSFHFSELLFPHL